MARNLLRLDPTRTGLIRRRFVADLIAVFDDVRKATFKFVATDDAFGLATNAPQPFRFTTSDKKVKGFNQWLKGQVNDKVLKVNPESGEPVNGKPWTAKHIESAYKKGSMRAYMDVNPQLGKSAAHYRGSQEGFLQSSFGRPERVDKLRLLYTRNFENLKGITSQMSAKMSRIFADGIAHGKSPMQIAKTLSKTIKGISETRAKVLARTEIIHAHAEGQLDSLEDLGVEEVNAQVEFSTAGDDGVCPKCEDLEGEVYTIAEARGVIPVHPNCRCTWIPYVDDDKD